ncbi:Probable gluconokinase [Strongyloides ratti]|uniref:Gluconokinase n=1 Tax=Strongyloides ratti TaxID=34506 RepID=A0A090L3H9_STRRB|nr:Probable gluconokinase [Strongyloides ratti]CEF64252.1 Probable gluconokinase [Strongyloides ratti]
MNTSFKPEKKQNDKYVIIVMGVSGSGKSTIGEYLSHQLNFQFIEGDTFHSTSNIEKMKSGVPLDDEDRLPWLMSINKKLQEEVFQNHKSTVLACSALKKKYRDILKIGFSIDNIIFVHLNDKEDEVKKRLMKRKSHFFNPLLLKSQYEALEDVTEDEGRKIIMFSMIQSFSELKNKIIQNL